MKTNKFLLVFAVAVLTYSSCSDEVDEVLDVNEGPVVTQDSVFTYDMVFDCDITSYDGTTRASMASGWEDGDIVYLHFKGTNDAYGKAEYINASKKWRVTCDKALVEATNATCEAWCGKGVDSMETNNYISYSFMTEAYSTSYGIYTYGNNSIYVKATMNPLGWRLRFKGEVGTTVSLYQSNSPYIHYYYEIYKSTNYIAYSSGNGYNRIHLTVGSNGYTEYFLGYTDANCSKITITKYGPVYFSRYFDSNTLKEGESGCFTIPTENDLHGWTREESE